MDFVRQAEKDVKQKENTTLTIFKDLYKQAKQKVSKLLHSTKYKFFTERITLLTY